MDIAFASRSRFLPAFTESLNRQRSALDAGEPASLSMETGGYGGNVVVTIDVSHPNEFETDWEGNDPTRFPARIKAAATALRDCGYYGRFRLAHSNGALTIQRL